MLIVLEVLLNRESMEIYLSDVREGFERRPGRAEQAYEVSKMFTRFGRHADHRQQHDHLLYDTAIDSNGWVHLTSMRLAYSRVTCSPFAMLDAILTDEKHRTSIMILLFTREEVMQYCDFWKLSRYCSMPGKTGRI